MNTGYPVELKPSCWMARDRSSPPLSVPQPPPQIRHVLEPHTGCVADEDRAFQSDPPNDLDEPRNLFGGKHILCHSLGFQHIHRYGRP